MSVKVIVIGAGLGGSLLANGLLRHNINFTLYERDLHAADKSAEQNGLYRGKRDGYQIRLGANALVGLKACLDQSQFDKCINLFGRSGGLISSAPIIYNARFDTVLQDLTKFPAYTKSAPINRVVLRNFLQEPIYQAGKLVYGKTFVRYEIFTGATHQGSKVRAYFADGSTDECDILISAEGSVSKVNTQIGINNIVPITDTVGFLAKGTISRDKIHKLPPEAVKSALTCVKDGKILFFSTYLPPISSDTKLDGGKGRDDDSVASIFWALNVPAASLPSEDIENVSDKIEFCINMISDWSPKYHSLLRVIDNDDIYVLHPRASKKPEKNWRRSTTTKDDHTKGHPRVWLMGDAIHPMLPGRGMGGNQAMRDAADILQSIITLNSKMKPDHTIDDVAVSAAVLKYEETMLPRAFDWVEKSGGLGKKFPDPESWQGRVSLFFVSRLLDLAYLITLIRQCIFRHEPTDDAPELPD